MVGATGVMASGAAVVGGVVGAGRVVGALAGVMGVLEVGGDQVAVTAHPPPPTSSR